MINDGEIVHIKDVLENILVRDNLDTTRKDSPLVIEKDAVVIDNSYLSIDDQLAKILALINQKIKL